MILKILVFIIFFLLLGGFLIISNENLKLNNGKNIDKFVDEYAIWLNNQFKSVKIMGNLIKNNFIKE